MREHTLIKGEGNIYKIKFTQPPFNDIMFSYNKVEIIEKDDHAVLSFEYNIHEGTVVDSEAFKKELGDFLLEKIEEEMAKGQLIYSGGVDEQNRTDDN